MIMLDSASARTEYARLGDRDVPRLFNGLWQLSSNSWGSAPAAKIRRYMANYADNGYVAFGEPPSFLSPPRTPLTRDVDRHGKGSSPPSPHDPPLIRCIPPHRRASRVRASLLLRAPRRS